MTASFVLDSSVALAWCFADEATRETVRLYDRMEKESAAIPGWWFIEIANVLALSERKGRIVPAKTAEFISLIARFKLEIDNDAPRRAFDFLLPLCRTHNLTSYDAIYLDLAIRRHLPLATLDEPLRKAAKKVGVKLLGK
ncbi:MAG TPA: type II toxin-antitoxin system VapC family toxin [Pirellulales bacterium]|jgi:predicted nucleic acid-binding protein|nr:type II toxin-antitoxin system VapC family toxin [Pirellulales bacterium]